MSRSWLNHHKLKAVIQAIGTGANSAGHEYSIVHQLDQSAK